MSSYNFTLRTPFSLKNLNYTKVVDTGYFDLTQLLNKTKDNNVLSLEGSVQMISFGYGFKKTYLYLDYSTKFNFDFRYPKDLLALLWKGNEEFIGKTANLDRLAVNFSHYNEISLGVAQQIGSHFSTGGRFKYIQGLSNLNTKKTGISLHTDTTTYWLTGTSDLLVNMAGPLNLDTFNLGSPVSYLFSNFKNPGFGIDLGASYQPNKQLSFAANVLDLGYIYWKNKPSNYSVNNPGFTFNGFTIDSLTNFNNIKNFDSLLTVFADSLTGEFDTVKTSDHYRTGLYPKIYISATYNFDDKNMVGMMYYHKFMGNTGQNSISALYAHKFGNTLATTVSYSLNDFKYSNLGLGLDLKFGSFQFYALCDNVLAAFATSSATTAHINLGLNFLIGKPVIVPKKEYKISNKLDTDLDGVPDVVDRCPYDSGFVLAEGCPDADRDSTPDLFDDCRRTPGPKFNNGCPVISKRDQQLIIIIVDLLEFRNGTDKMKSSVFIYLDELVGLLKEQPTMLLKMEGHAYDMPTLSENLKLSKARVNSLSKYLTDNGIDPKRIKMSWYGSDRPLFDASDPGTPVKRDRIEMGLYFK